MKYIEVFFNTALGQVLTVFVLLCLFTLFMVWLGLKDINKMVSYSRIVPRRRLRPCRGRYEKEI